MAQFLAPEQLETSSGSPLSGGKKHVYAVGTTTALSLFSDDTLSTPAANPIVADSSGAFAGVFLAETQCKQLVTTSADVTVFSRAVFYTVGVSNVLAADDVSYSGATSGLASEDVQAAIDEVVALQATSQAWTSASDGPIATGTSTNAGAAAGPLVEMYRNSASPANSDVVGGLRITGKNASAVKTTLAQVHGVIIDTTNASEDAKVVVQTVVAGALADRVHIGAGAWMDGATGGDPGAGNINATEVRQAGSAIRPLISGTVQATTSGTSIDFSSIPSWAKRVNVLFGGVSTNGGDEFLVQIGDSGGIETTGYVSAGSESGGNDNSTAGFIATVAYSSANTVSGRMSIELADPATNLWVASGSIGIGVSHGAATGGHKALSAALDRVRITTTGGVNTFDAGSINISYE